MTPNPADLLDILRCPETGQNLRAAPPDMVQELERRRVAGDLLDRGGKPFPEPLAAGLVREDGLVFYPVRGGIPILLVEDSILLDKGAFPL
jgi:uncharacterized protein YbaR (Trm112 family)